MDRQTIEIPAAEKHTPATTRLLHVVRGPHIGQVLAVPDEGAVLGRGDDADLQLHDDGLSRTHVRFEVAGDALRVIDLDSRNGTHVHGGRIREPVLVYAGELIQVGRLVLRVGHATELDGGAAEDLYEAATRDPLTGLHNRRFFDDRLRVEFAFARRHRTDLAVLVLDVDGFGRLNELGGRGHGDALLRGMAVQLMGSTRVEDLVARYTGDTFIVVARNTAAEGAEVLAERLRARISAAPTSSRSGSLTVAASVGIAVRSKDQPYATAAGLVEAAFDAMRRAKRAGGDCVVSQLVPVQPPPFSATTYNMGTTSGRVEILGAAR